MRVSSKVAVLGLVSVLMLAGCGGGGGASNPISVGGGGGQQPSAVTLQGVVADGYLKNALVFADCNNNRIFDVGEATTTTGQGGIYTLTGHGINECVVVVDVIAGQTVDDDDPLGQPVAQGYTLMAPAGKTEFISPLTTLLQGVIDEGQSLAAAEEALLADLPSNMTITGLYDDYIKAQNIETHSIAKAVAKTIAYIKAGGEALGAHAEENIPRSLWVTKKKLAAIVADPENFDPAVQVDLGTDFGITPSMLAGKTFIAAEGVGETGIIIITNYSADLTYKEWANDYSFNGVKAPLYNMTGTWSINANGEVVLLDSLGSTSLKLASSTPEYFDLTVVAENLPQTARVYKTAPFTESLLAGKSFDFLGNGPGSIFFAADGTGYTVESTLTKQIVWSIDANGILTVDTGKFFLFAGGNSNYFKVAGYDSSSDYIGTLVFTSAQSPIGPGEPQLPAADQIVSVGAQYILGQVASSQGGVSSHTWSLVSGPSGVTEGSVISLANLSVGTRWVFQSSVQGRYVVKETTTNAFTQAVTERTLLIDVN